MTQSCFAVPKNIRLSSTCYFVLKIPSKRELQQITFNHSSNIDFQDFMNPFLKNEPQNRILFLRLIPLLHHKILQVIEIIF